MAAEAGAKEVSAVEVIAEDVDRVTQAPSDVLRMAVSVIVLVFVTIAASLFGETMAAFVAGILRGLDGMPDWFMSGLAVGAQVIGALLIVAGFVAVVRARAWLVAVAALAAAVLAGALTGVLSNLFGDAAARISTADPLGAVGGGQAWSAGAVAALAAVVTATAPWVPRSWRRVAWALVIMVGIVHFVNAPVAFDTLEAVLCGWVAGSIVVVFLGAPSRRPTGRSIADGLAAVGVPLAKLEQASLDARGSTPYFGTTADGSKLFVKALGADERSADLLFRIYRRLQPRDLGDEKAFSSLRRAVEHEAFVSMGAAQLGIRTPRLAAFATAEPEGFVLAYDAIDGRSLDRLDHDEVTDDVLDRVWAQLALMRSHRVAHRDLRLANVFLAADGEAWIIDFGFSELAASDLLLATDLAELVASSATVVGAQRAVDAGVRAVGGATLATALPRLQLAMLSGATRTALKEQPGRLIEIRAQLGPMEA